MQTLRNGLLMLFTAALLVACSLSTPEKVAQDYINAVLANDIDGIVSTLAIPANAQSGHDTVVRGKLSVLLAQASSQAIRYGGVKEVLYSKAVFNTEKTRATIVATIHYKKDNAPTREERILLLKIEDVWKVSL